MKLNHKFKLVPISETDEATNISDIKTRMESVLTSKHTSDNEKISLYADLLARLRNYNSELDIPPSFKIHTPERSDLVPQFSGKKKDKIDKISANVRANNSNEMVIDGRVIPNTNMEEILNYAFKKSDKPMPLGYEEFYTRSSNVGGLTPPEIPKPKKKKVPPIPKSAVRPPRKSLAVAAISPSVASPTGNSRTIPSPTVASPIVTSPAVVSPGTAKSRSSSRKRVPPVKLSPSPSKQHAPEPSGNRKYDSMYIRNTPKVGRSRFRPIQSGSGRRKKRLNIRLWKCSDF